MYTTSELKELKDFYSKQLLEDTLPFWFPRSLDTESGGFLLMRDRDGSLLDDDKAVWIQGRFTWLLSTLYTTVSPRKDWLDAARNGMSFLRQHCFDSDGRMFFHVDRAGRPLRKRRYFFSETFTILAASAYSRASGDKEVMVFAEDLFKKVNEYIDKPHLLPAKFTDIRPTKSIGLPMMMIIVSQQLREDTGNQAYTAHIDRWIAEIERDFVKHDIACVMEQVSPEGEIINHIDGRTLNPGHAIECAWFILHEAHYRNNDKHLLQLGCKMLDYMWERGWDKEYGGILYYRDVYNKPVQEYWQDMKFWWPQNETIIATLLAYLLTGEEKYARWHQKIHNYAYANFHDKKYGEWFGYLHREGRIAQSAKGNMYKGPFHLPRQEWYCMQLLAKKMAPEKPSL